MSDWNPNQYDKYGNSKFEPIDDSGRGPYVLLAILVLIGLVGGLLYFNGTPKQANEEQARAPSQSAPAHPTPIRPDRGPANPGPAITPNQPANPMPAPTNPPKEQE